MEKRYKKSKNNIEVMRALKKQSRFLRARNVKVTLIPINDINQAQLAENSFQQKLIGIVLIGVAAIISIVAVIRMRKRKKLTIGTIEEGKGDRSSFGASFK